MSLFLLELSTSMLLFHDEACDVPLSFNYFSCF